MLDVIGQLVKRKILANDVTILLDHFCESTFRINELKLNVVVKLHEDNNKLESKSRPLAIDFV